MGKSTVEKKQAFGRVSSFYTDMSISGRTYSCDLVALGSGERGKETYQKKLY